jgi:hypothetical protein
VMLVFVDCVFMVGGHELLPRKLRVNANWGARLVDGEHRRRHPPPALGAN